MTILATFWCVSLGGTQPNQPEIGSKRPFWGCPSQAQPGWLDPSNLDLDAIQHLSRMTLGSSG